MAATASVPITRRRLPTVVAWGVTAGVAVCAGGEDCCFSGGGKSSNTRAPQCPQKRSPAETDCWQLGHVTIGMSQFAPSAFPQPVQNRRPGASGRPQTVQNCCAGGAASAADDFE